MEVDEAEVIDISQVALAKLERIGDLLRVLKLAQLEPLFVREEIDLKTLFFLTDAHLVRLGLDLSQRIKLLRCIQLFKDIPVNPRFAPVAQQQRQKPPPPIAQPPPIPAPAPAQAAAAAVPPPIPKKQEARQPPPLPSFRPKPAAAATTAPQYLFDSKSLAFVVYDTSANLCLKHAKLLEQSFERDLKIDRVSLLGVGQGDAELATAELFRFLNICSNAQDELLWFIFLGNGQTGVNDLVQPLVQCIFDTFPGKQVFFVLDSVQSSFAQDLAFPLHARNALGFSLLTSSYPQAPNPLYLSLCLLDTMRGNVAQVHEMATEYPIERFVDECFAQLEFLERCSDTSIQVNYLPGDEVDVVQGLTLLRSVDAAPVGAQHQSHVGRRGIYKDRPVQIVLAKANLVRVRFLEEFSDPEYCALEDILLDYEDDGDDGGGEAEEMLMEEEPLLEDDFFNDFQGEEWREEESALSL